MHKFSSAAEMFQEASDAVRNADSSTLGVGSFVKFNGCVCAAGQVVYNNDPQIKAAVDGFRLLREAKMLDEDQLDIIASTINERAIKSWTNAVADIPITVWETLLAQFDTTFEENGQTAAADRLAVFAVENRVAA